MSLPKELYVKQGRSVVLLLHAYAGSPNDVRMLARVLEEKEYSIYSPMFSGHGTLNPLDILNESPSVWEKDVKRWVAFLKEEGFTQAAVFGLSMGGIFALNQLTQESFFIGGGAFCSPIFSKEKNHVVENFKIYAEKVLELAQVEKGSILQEVDEKSPLILQGIQTFASGVGERLGKVSVPIFLAQAGEDEMIDSLTVYDTAKALAQTKVTTCWYPKSTHVITIGKERKELERDVVDFLATLAWEEK